MLYHIVKHFFLAGIGVRHLIDLSLYYNTYKSQIDLKLLWRHLRQLEYEFFCSYIFSICIKRFNMNVEIYPEYVSVEPDLENKILFDILSGGVFGKRTVARELSSRFLRPYYEDSNKKIPTSRIHLIISFLFPSKKELERIDFIELSENKVVAWFQRTAHLASRWYLRKKRNMQSCNIKERVDCSIARLEIIKQAKLIKENEA